MLYVGLQGEFGVTRSPPTPPALVVTCRGPGGRRKARQALHHVVPDARVKGAAFPGVLLAYADGDPVPLAARVTSCCDPAIARVTAVLAQTPSTRRPMLEAAVRAAIEHVRPGRTFAVRIHKRGAHGYVEPTPALERDAGTALSRALQDRDGSRPPVDLVHADVIVNIEVFGPHSLVGVVRSARR